MENYEFIKKKDLPIFAASWFFHLGSVHIEENQHKTKATFDLFIRELPNNRNYFVASGLNSIVDFLINFKFTLEQIKYFRDVMKLPEKTIRYYQDLRFTGDVWAIPEGTIVFPNEPIIRITAPIVEAEIIERYLINTLMVNMIFASKISRYVNIVKKYFPEVITGLNYTRSHGIQASSIVIRNAKMVGVDLISSPFLAIAQKKKSKAITTTHAFISSFDSEEEALCSFSKYLKDCEGLWLVDTYNVIEGIKKFINIVTKLKKQDKPYPIYIHLDSGNLAKSSKIARKLLDKSGLGEIKICIATNLDEYKISKLYKQKIICDLMLAGTELTTSSDSSKLEVVYKLSELEKNNQIVPKMKLSSKKISLPGKKQVYRVSNNGQYQFDVIGLENEKIANSEKLLKHTIKNGKLIEKPSSLEEIKKHYENNKKKFNNSLFYISKKINYPVNISNNLSNLIKITKKKIERLNVWT